MLSVLLFCLQNLMAEPQEDFQRRLDYLNQRYTDFKIHQEKQKAFDLERQSGARDMKILREKDLKLRDQARRDYIKNRKNFEIKGEEEYLRQQRLAAAAHDRARKGFVQEQKQIQRIEETVKHIPPEKEYGVYDYDPARRTAK